ncbi:MAG: hypothetical protein ABJE95_16925 [Byssovorax sp.]
MRRALHRIARSPLEFTLAFAALVAAVYAIAAPFAAARYPAMTDLPFHAAQTSTLRHWLDPSFHQQDQFEIHPLAVPYLSMYAVGAALMTIFPMIIAVKIAAALMIALLPAGLAVMFHGMKKSPLLGLLGLGPAWSSLTHWGFLNFMGAIGLFAMAVGFTFLVVDKPTRGRQIALAATLITLFFTHIFRYPFALCAVVGTAIVMYPVTRRLRPIALPLLPAIALFVVWLRVRPPVLEGSMGPLSVHKERLADFPAYLGGAFTDPAEKLAFESLFRTLVVVALVCLAARAWAYLEGGEIERERGDLTWDALALVIPLGCAAVFLALYLVLPMEIGLWWYVFPREATAAAFLLLGAFPDLPKPLWMRAPLVAALAAGGLRVSAVVTKNYAVFDQATADFAAITKEIPRSPKLLYLVFEHGGSTRTTTPFIHLPAYVQAEKGGWLSFHFATWGATPIQYRTRGEPGAVIPPATPLRWEWTPQIFNVTRSGAFFDWFLVRRGSSPDALFQADPSIERVDHVGTWWLYRRRARP